MNRTAKGALVALSVAALFSTGGVVWADAGSGAKAEAKVKCKGVNACAGKGQCASASNECAGKNSCKGQGILKMSAEECAQKGGTVVN